MMYNMFMHVSFLPTLNLWVSGNFPETTWRAFKVVRWIHTFYVQFWVPVRNRLAACCQAMRAIWLNFLMFWDCWVFLIRGKVIIGVFLMDVVMKA